MAPARVMGAVLTQLNGCRLAAHSQVVQRLLAVVRRSALIHLSARHHQHRRRCITHKLVLKMDGYLDGKKIYTFAIGDRKHV